MAEFDERKHPRKKDGKFAPKGKGESRKAELERKYNDELEFLLYVSGAKSGALNPKEIKDWHKVSQHAKLMYETFRNVKSDVLKIAKITGLKEKQIQEIKEYLFFNSEFSPDFDQAQSWNRLWKGNPVKADFIFIKHELLEMLLRKQGLSYDDAHIKANEKYNYQKEIEKYNDGILKKERSNKR